MKFPAPITSHANARVKALRRAFHGKASRPGELVGIEGYIALTEAAKAGLRFDAIFVKASVAAELQPEIIGRLAPREMLVLNDDVFDSVVDTVSPQEIAATLAIPPESVNAAPTGTFLLLEDIQDPGNLGTLIRSANAFGVERVYLSPKCANPWSPKVIRASAGSVFRQPISRLPILTAMRLLREQGVRIAAAVLEGDSASISYETPLAAPIAIVIGNEGAGLTERVIAVADENVYVPCHTESLNAAVAGSVLLYEAQRQTLYDLVDNLPQGLLDELVQHIPATTGQ